MGIFTSAGFSGSSVDIYSPAEEELCCEGFDINFYEASMVAVAESEAVYNNSMKEVGIAELRYFEENSRKNQVNYGCAPRKFSNFRGAFFIGIPFVITNYFCGDKPIYAALNAARSTSSTTSGVCLA